MSVKKYKKIVKTSCKFANNGICLTCGVRESSQAASVCNKNHVEFKKLPDDNKWKSLPFKPAQFIENEPYYYCFFCKKILSQEQVTKDHLIPTSRGGSNTRVNLKPCCYECNIEKGNMMWYVYIMLRIFQNRITSIKKMLSHILNILNKDRETISNHLLGSEEFLSLVRLELSKIKQYATQDEWDRLITAVYNYKINGADFEHCVYGTLANTCFSERAVELINKCSDVLCVKQNPISYESDRVYKFLPNNNRLIDKVGEHVHQMDLRTLPSILTPVELLILGDPIPEEEEISETIEDYIRNECHGTIYIMDLINYLHNGKSIIDYRNAELPSKNSII